MRPYAPARANGSPRSHRESSPRMYYASPRDQAARPAGLSYQIQDNIPASPCHESSDDDQLLNEFFDWDRYYQTQETLVHQTPYPSPPRSPPRRHDSLKNPGIPAVAGQFGNLDFYPSMASSYGYPRHSSGSQSPPELVTGGNSPSEHSSAVSIDRFEEARRYHAISLKDFQAQDDEWTYPQDDLTRVLPQEYPSHLHVEHHRHRASDSSAGVKRRHSGKGSEKRHRHLSDPNQTADVRKNGACLPCRVLKTRCAESGVCPTCRKSFPDHAHLVCNRETPAMAWPMIGKSPDVWSSSPLEEQMLCAAPRIHYGRAREIVVFFNRDPSSPEMRVHVQPYRSREMSDDSTMTVDFPREMVPSHEQMQKWAEDQIVRDHSTDFYNAVQTFLLAYANDGEGLPKHRLVSKVHKMNCFFRIWKSPAFWCLDPANNFTSLPTSVSARLRYIAHKALDRIEHDILKDLDDCLTPNGAPKSQERLAIWACLWQLMMMYRELIPATEEYLTQATAYGVDPSHLRSASHYYRRLTESFFPMLTMFYHYQFRTKKSLEVSLDWLKSSSSYPSRALRSKMLHYTARDLVDSRREFYHHVQTSEHEVDRMLSVLVVDHEVKKLNARKRPSKSSSSSSKSSSKSRSSSYYDEYDY